MLADRNLHTRAQEAGAVENYLLGLVTIGAMCAMVLFVLPQLMHDVAAKPVLRILRPCCRRAFMFISSSVCTAKTPFAGCGRHACIGRDSRNGSADSAIVVVYLMNVDTKRILKWGVHKIASGLEKYESTL